jgi:hypothetical protein
VRSSLVALLLLAAPVQAENAPDHLQCYRVGKAPALKKFFGSFEVGTGCTISKARFLCVPRRSGRFGRHLGAHCRRRGGGALW